MDQKKAEDAAEAEKVEQVCRGLEVLSAVIEYLKQFNYCRNGNDDNTNGPIVVQMIFCVAKDISEENGVQNVDTIQNYDLILVIQPEKFDKMANGSFKYVICRVNDSFQEFYGLFGSKPCKNMASHGFHLDWPLDSIFVCEFPLQ